MHRKKSKARSHIAQEVIVNVSACGVTDPGQVVAATMQHPDATESLVQRASREREWDTETYSGKLGTLGIDPVLLQQPCQSKGHGRR